MTSTIKTIEWLGSSFRIIDQRSLPSQLVYADICTYPEAVEAITHMLIRGAPAIGIAGAFGLVLAAQSLQEHPLQVFIDRLNQAAQLLKQARPTAVNLAWAVDKLLAVAEKKQDSGIQHILQNLEKTALDIHHQDIEANYTIGQFGQTLAPKQANFLTHCNAGALATGGYGTALGVIRSAFANDPHIHVYVDETRPRLQGAKLTAWELQQDNIPFTLISDNMAGYLMYQQKIDLIVVGADRIAINGDTANKIGTYSLAILAKEHSIPFYIAAPLSTIDINIQSGKDIPVEHRSSDEVTSIDTITITPQNIQVYNPAFDITPAQYITGIITERGILKPNYEDSISQVLALSQTF